MGLGRWTHTEQAESAMWCEGKPHDSSGIVVTSRRVSSSGTATVQILVVVANIRVRILNAEVGKCPVGTPVAHG